MELTLESVLGDAVAHGVSDPDGRFSLKAARAGSYFLVARYLGSPPFKEGPIELTEDDALVVEFILPFTAVAIEGLTVEVDRQVRHLAEVGFYARARDGGGVHIPIDDLVRRGGGSVRRVLSSVPGIEVPNSEQPGSGYVLFTAAERATIGMTPGTVCAPRVFIDGAVVQAGGPTPFEDVLDPDQLVRVGDLAGIEIYRRPAEVPVRFGGAQSLCGVLVLWTRVR